MAAFGVKGELILQHTLGKKTALKGVAAVFIEDRKDSFLPWFIENASVKSPDEINLKLEGIDSREAAQKLVQKEVWLPETDFKKLAAKSAPVSLLGYMIVDNKKPLGEILEIIEQPHQLICRIDIQGKEVLIPLNENFLQSIDHKKKTVQVELPEGLLDVYL